MLLSTVEPNIIRVVLFCVCHVIVCTCAVMYVFCVHGVLSVYFGQSVRVVEFIVTVLVFCTSCYISYSDYKDGIKQLSERSTSLI